MPERRLRHLDVAAVLAIHAEVLAAHGGLAGVRDRGLLESAVAAPQASFGGKPLIGDPLEVAAAYLFYAREFPTTGSSFETPGAIRAGNAVADELARFSAR